MFVENMYFVDNVIPSLHRFIGDGEQVAIATLVGVEGSTPRPLGSQLVIAESGRTAGMITGGCAEKAIIAEARQCLKENKNKLVRYGEGSPYLDVVLPCGSGIDIHVETNICKEIAETVHSRQVDRRTTCVVIDRDSLKTRIVNARPSEVDDRIFVRTYFPDYQIFVFGEGANLITFSSIAITAGFSVKALSPDEKALTELEAVGVNTQPIHHSFDFSSLPFDEYSAVVTLFHEHEWEVSILSSALNSSADYIGALGSKKTHTDRLKKLHSVKRTNRPPESISGPVGLDIGAQNPNEIAVSILAEIISHRRQVSR